MAPDTRANAGNSNEESKASKVSLLDDDRVRFVRITWVDYVNFVRYRVVPIEYFKKLVTSSSSTSSKYHQRDDEILIEVDDGERQRGARFNLHGGITLAKIALGLVYLTMAEGFGATGEYLYVPDLTTARWLPYAPGTAGVLGHFEEKQVEVDEYSSRTFNVEKAFRVPLCPRTILHRIVDEARHDYKVTFLVGFETEVIFLSSVDPIKAVNDYGWSESPAISAGKSEAEALEEIASALEEAGIELQMYHAEAAPGQYEIVTGPLPPLEACDALIATREIIMNVASKYGIRATLAPRVYGNSCGSAAHTHISLASASPTPSFDEERTPVRVSAPPSVYLTALEQSFLSGLLSHLPSALAFTLPTRASYARMVDGVWSGGTWACWGRDNRESPIRLAGRGGPTTGAYNFEVKSIDGTANPYLAVASLLVAGLTGIRGQAELKSVGLHVPAASLSDEERKSFGVERRMPLSIEEARKALQNDEAIKKALGEEFVKSYLSVNKTLNEQLQAPTPEEEMIKLVKTF